MGLGKTCDTVAQDAHPQKDPLRRARTLEQTIPCDDHLKVRKAGVHRHAGNTRKLHDPDEENRKEEPMIPRLVGGALTSIMHP